ncbi:hypothetical protein [Nonomuraea dietziae]|uniref:hypothetical protein n=1 Tax=Nonomuraea dietziae TaxID=65515 RepID=UPI0034213308
MEVGEVAFGDGEDGVQCGGQDETWLAARADYEQTTPASTHAAHKVTNCKGS